VKIPIYDQSGKKIGDHTLNSAIFEASIKESLIQQALLRQLANKRANPAKTKTRGERRGGGRKPFRQKGTGNARAGSRRSPIWRKGGVIFGPTGLENYSKQMPKKQRQQALFSILSSKAKDGKIIALDKYEGEIKTKVFAELISKLPIERDALIVIPEKNEVVQKSAHNIANVKVILANYLNPADLLKYRNLIFLAEALKKVDEIWGAETKKPKNKKTEEQKT